MFRPARSRSTSSIQVAELFQTSFGSALVEKHFWGADADRDVHPIDWTGTSDRAARARPVERGWAKVSGKRAVTAHFQRQNIPKISNKNVAKPGRSWSSMLFILVGKHLCF